MDKITQFKRCGLKIVFISGNLSNGGAQRVISVISGALANRGHDVSILVFSRCETEYPINPEVNIVSIADSYEEYDRISSIKRLNAVRKFLKAEKPDAAIGFLEGGYALYLASFGMKFAKVASARVDPAILMKGKGFRATINRMWFKSADAVVLQTNSQLDHVSEKIAKRSVVIPNPVSEAALLADKNDYSSGTRFVMAGRLAKQKNYPMVFDAVKLVKEKYPEVHVDIFGKGNLESELSDMIEKMGLSGNITLCGWSRDTVSEYAKHDAYILSSDFEGMPNALMEAMAVGLPCISTNCDTGPSDLITDGENGYLIPVGDSSALAEKMIAIIEMSAEDREKCGDNAKSYLNNNYNENAISDKWEYLFEKLNG